MKNKSEVLIISTIINIIIGIEVLIIVSRFLIDVFEIDNLIVGAILVFIPQTFAIIILLLIIFELFTAWISFETNQKIWTTVHIIVLIIVSIIGQVFNLLYSDILHSKFGLTPFFSASFVFAVILRIVGYFNQKKINDKS